ncbi:transcriptional regulator, TraR/DksA family [Desulfacinum infernum DSM 9756]|uniref:Transcriptional regulator, TraR/DksA family n=2 Tax=Desulfacinum infernum TaxID=35837 RepID=A0A1M4XPA5_9BACT|nr:transcriptional regulator, TraR/DksA family [Desulfacinum infernum DSM 9756]
MQAALVRSLEAVQETLGSREEHRGPMDMADEAEMEHQRETLWNLGYRYRQFYREVTMALNRLAKDEFGYCEDCGDPIAEARLEVQPTARLCIDCQRELERRTSLSRQGGRKRSSDGAAPERMWDVDWRHPECVNA